MRHILPVLVLGACLPASPLADARKPKPPPTPPPVSEAQALPPVEPAVVLAMHRQLDLVDDLRNAVIHGDMDKAKGAAHKLSTLPPVPGVPDEWGPWLLRVKESASRVEDEPWDTHRAARVVAEIGRTCGGCHHYLEAGPVAPGDGDPGLSGEGVEGHMSHHAKAADAMWMGLVTADDLYFARAAKGLSEARLGEDDAAGKLDHKVHQLAAYGARVRGLATRADTYGSIIATCAECHTAEKATP